MNRGSQNTSAQVVDLTQRNRELSDSALVLAAREGRAWAKEALFRRHLRSAYGLAFRLLGSSSDVEDVVQESMANALESLDSLREPKYFGSWLGRMVINGVHKVVKRRRMLARLHLAPAMPVEQDLVARGAPPEAALELELIYRTLSDLPVKVRTALILRRVEGLPLLEVSELMGTSESSVKRWIKRADDALREATAIKINSLESQQEAV